MNKKVFIISIIILATGSILSSAFFVITQKNKKDLLLIEVPVSKVTELTVTSTVNISITTAPTATPIETKIKNVIGWIASFDYKRGKESFYANINKFTEISPVYYDLKDDGTISSRSVSGDQDLVTKSHKNSVKVIPTIINSNADAIDKLLSDDTKLKSHNDFLISEIKKNNYDGIDIDYEIIYLKNKDKFFDLISDLATKLHNINKRLSITVLPKTSDITSTTRAETKQVQEWDKFAQYVDEIRVMAYDYSSSTENGPVSPIDWVEQIIGYGKSKNIKDKLVIGQPFYAYAYGKTRYSYTYNEIIEIINSQKLTSSLNERTGEKVLQFKKGDESRTMYYEDSETMQKRFDLILRNNIAGVSFWRLGGEDSQIYTKLENQR